MKTYVECLPCLLRQSLQVARISNCSEELQMQIVQEVSAILADLDAKRSPPANARAVYRKIVEITGCEDPYLAKKKLSNAQALQLLPGLKKEIQGTEQELDGAVRFAIAGNIIDYGALADFDVVAALERSRKEELAVDDSELLFDTIVQLEKGAKILYLTDNCGEIVYDSLLIGHLYRSGFDICVAVKGGPIINDALLEDAYGAGLDSYARMITNGSRCPGTVLDECSAEFLSAFDMADLIIAKGQGNFESLSEVKRDIFFLLTIKCAVAGQHLAELAGVDGDRLQGKCEMAVYFSGKKK